MHRIVARSDDGRAAVELTYHDGTLPADLAAKLGLLSISLEFDGYDLTLHALPHVARRLGSTEEQYAICNVLGGPCVVVESTALGACDLVRAYIVRGVLDKGGLEAALLEYLSEWEAKHPPETTLPYDGAEDRDYAVSTWRADSGEWFAVSGDSSAHAATLPDAVAALFHSMEAP